MWRVGWQACVPWGGVGLSSFLPHPPAFPFAAASSSCTAKGSHPVSPPTPKGLSLLELSHLVAL